VYGEFELDEQWQLLGVEKDLGSRQSALVNRQTGDDEAWAAYWLENPVSVSLACWTFLNAHDLDFW